MMLWQMQFSQALMLTAAGRCVFVACVWVGVGGGGGAGGPDTLSGSAMACDLPICLGWRSGCGDIGTMLQVQSVSSHFSWPEGL